MTRVWPLANGNASKKAIDFEVVEIIFDFISPLTILQKMQSNNKTMISGDIKSSNHGLTIVPHANPSPNLILVLLPGVRSQLAIVLGMESEVST